MKHLAVVGFLVCLVGVASAADAPVSRGEVAKVVNRVESVMRLTLGIPGSARMVKPAAGVATRVEVLGEFNRLYDLAYPKFKVTAVPVKVLASHYTVGKGVPLTQATRLVSAGCVSVVGPLVAGKTSGLSLEEFGDAVGYLLARIAELTHMPSTKFTPSLQRG